MIKLNKKYSSLVTSDERYSIITGGRGSGKSFSVTAILCLMMLEENTRILFARKTLTSAHLSIIPEFLQKLELLGIANLFHITKTEITHKTNGSAIFFRGLTTSSSDNTANLKSLQGISKLVIDESEELTNELMFDKIDFSVRQKGVINKVILIMNPATKSHWIYTRFFEQNGVEAGFNGTKGNVTYIHTTYLDNAKNLDESFLNEIERLKEKNIDKYNHQILGGWLNTADGVIFVNWEIGEYVDTGYELFGADFGFSIDENTLVQVSVDNKNMILYVKELLYKTGLTTDDLYHEYYKHCGTTKQIIADSAEPRLIEELKGRGINIKGAIKGQGSITAGIAKIQNYKMIVDPNSINLHKELNNYAWSDKISGRPIDKYNHCFIGNTLITTDEGLKPIKDIKVGDLVLTRKGYKKVLKKFNNGVKKVNKYSMQSDTFSVYLCSTKEHKILSETWKEISKLQSGEMVYQHKHSTDLFLDYIQKNDISRWVQKECSLTYGNITMVKNQKDIIYTIKMKMLQIIDQKTWNVLKRTNTLASILKLGLKKIKNGLKNFIQKELNLQKNGISQKKVGNGILNMEKECGLIESTKIIIANNVEKNLNQDILELSSAAITTARLKHFEIGESWSEEVYDIMVDECHEYFANGILVHNCLDALRYSVSELIEPEPKLSGSMASYFGL